MCDCVTVSLQWADLIKKEKRNESWSSDSWSPCHAWWSSGASLSSHPLFLTACFSAYYFMSPATCVRATLYEQCMWTHLPTLICVKIIQMYFRQQNTNFYTFMFGVGLFLFKYTQNEVPAVFWVWIETRLWARPYRPTQTNQEWRPLQQHTNPWSYGIRCLLVSVVGVVCGKVGEVLPSLLAEKCHYVEVDVAQVCFSRSPEQTVFIGLVVWVYLFRILFHILIPLSYYY